MKKHPLGFKFHMLIVYLVLVTLVAQSQSKPVINFPDLLLIDVSNIPRYVPGPSAKGIIPRYVPGPSTKVFIPRYVPGPSTKRFLSHHVPGPSTKGFFSRYVPGPSTKGFISHHVPGPSTKGFFPRYVPGPSTKGSFPRYVPGPSTKGFISRHVPGPSTKGFIPHYVPGPSTKENFKVKSWNTWVGVALTGSVVVVFFISLLSVSIYELGKRKGSSVVPYRNTSTSDSDQVNIMHGVSQTSRGIHVEAGSMVISIQDLENATNNFSQDNILGRGGSATVYKGELHDGTKIAIKRMKSSDMVGGLDEFQSEIAVPTKFRHRHLVALLGYCLDGNERLLVYEYMPQGTLSRFLFDWEQEGLRPLEWMQRLIIGLDVARGVQYLHGLAQQSFIHRDLKPSNILLGDDMRAKVADFGLVRPALRGEYSFVPRADGTFGYRAPEYAGMGRVTAKIDVFSFGVILMELITGRKAVDKTREEGVHLMQWLRMHIDEGTFEKAIDPTLDLDEEAIAGVSKVVKLARHCCAYEPNHRPDMSHVVNVLSSLVEPWNPSEPDPDASYGINLDKEALASLARLGGLSVSNAYNFKAVL